MPRGRLYDRPMGPGIIDGVVQPGFNSIILASVSGLTAVSRVDLGSGMRRRLAVV